MNKILGIDVGGTKIAIGLVDKSLRLGEVKVVPTSQTNLTKQLLGLIESYKGFDAIGLAMPGQVLPNGVVTRLPNIRNFSPTNFKQLLTKRYKVPVNVINDSKAFALAESVTGKGKAQKTVAGLILGTGIGMGVVINKQLYMGKDGLAGEFEHITLLDGQMLRDHRHAAGKFKNAQEAKSYLQTILSTIILSFNPDLIVLGGSWSTLQGMEKLVNQLATNVGGYTNKTPVKISTLKHAGVIGAALTVLKR